MINDEFIAPPCNQKVEVLYEDESLLIVDKPSGLLSLSGKHPLNKDSVHHRLVQQYPTATMVHRLDFGTSGVMVLALNKNVNAALTKQFQSRTITKKYQAILYGHLARDEGQIDVPIAKGLFPYQKVCFKTGKLAQSSYQVLERIDDELTRVKTSKVLFTPKTGRTHQLRVHSREIGHPIIGCDLYGVSDDGIDTADLVDRLCLHASSLEFEHPANCETMAFTSDSDFEGIKNGPLGPFSR